MDYLNYWSLHRRPFVTDDPSYFFAGSPQRRAIARLTQVLAARLDVAILVSPGRCGSTRLLRRISKMRGFGDTATEVVCSEGQIDSRADAFAELAAGLGFPAGVGLNPESTCHEQIDRAINTASARGVQSELVN